MVLLIFLFQLRVKPGSRPLIMQELIGLMLFALISIDWPSRVVPVKVGLPA